jgi:cell fate regulator YaaT (PSP1 superfamily)
MELMDKQAKEASEKCKEKIKKHNLEMFLAFTEYSFDGSKINFVFTADDRVDFRDLVKDLAKTFQKQIHLQQIGPRDKARLITGRGKCGQGLCCSNWLKDLESITMDMVRSQNLESKGSSKLSGCCGKLLCCLKYEVEEYKNLKKNLPRVGNLVKLKKKNAEVIGLDILNQKVKVFCEDKSIEIVHKDDIKKIISNKSKEERPVSNETD